MDTMAVRDWICGIIRTMNFRLMSIPFAFAAPACANKLAMPCKMLGAAYPFGSFCSATRADHVWKTHRRGIFIRIQYRG